MTSDKTGDPENAVIANQLAERKDELSLTFEDLSERSGIPLRSVKRYIRDERIMSIKLVRKLSRALDLDYLAVIAAAEEIGE